MGPEAFRRLLAGLASAPGTGDRRALSLVDDERLEWGRGDEPDVIVREFPEQAYQTPGEWPNGQAENLLTEFYRTDPVSRTGFDRQARALFTGHGSQALAARIDPWRLDCRRVDQRRTEGSVQASRRTQIDIQLTGNS